MKKISLMLILVIYMLNANTQTKPGNKLNFYFNTFLSEKIDFDFKSDSFSSSHKQYATLNSHAFSLGYQWNTSKKMMTELEIMPLRFSKSENIQYYSDTISEFELSAFGYNFQIYNSSARFSYQYLFGYPKLNFLIGASCNIFYLNKRIVPNTPRFFFHSNTTTGIALGLLAGLQYNVSENIVLRLDIPLTLFDLFYQRSRIDDPAMSPEQRSTDFIGSYVFDHPFLFRIGIGCKI